MDATSTLENQIKKWSEELGFIACGYTSADILSDGEIKNFDAWLQLGYHGEMKYMENHRDKRLNPSALIPGAKSVICLAYNYFPDNDSIKKSQKHTLKIAKYAWGEDYHKVVKDKVHLLMQRILQIFPSFEGRGFTDSAPIMERQLAQRAGLGWIGKNSLLLRKGTGSYFFLAEIISNLPLKPDEPWYTDHCGSCTACIDACPTQAIVSEQLIDSNRCISYQTIELKGPSTLSHEQQQGWVYGCDICQDVCPWNRFSEANAEPRFGPKQYALADDDTWKEWVEEPNLLKPHVQGTAAERTGHRKILDEAKKLLNG